MNKRKKLEELIRRLDVNHPEFAGSPAVREAFTFADVYIKTWILPELVELLTRENEVYLKNKMRKCK